MIDILAKVTFGSHLYGTSIPTSDDDFRAVYLPTIQSLALQRAKDAWEDKAEDDTSIFSLQHFCRLASEGQSIAIELLSAPDSAVKITSPIWETLRANRKRFYTKNMHSFLGYAKTMAGKYSARIDRLNETADVLSSFEQFSSNRSLDGSFLWRDNARLSDIWNSLRLSLNAEKSVNERGSSGDKRVYRVCGRELQATLAISHAWTIVKGIHDSYGERVRKAREGQIDWKSMSHAFRAALQCKEIVETGDLHFPLKDAEWLRDLRLGKFNFLECGLDRKLDDLIAEVQAKMEKSDLPEKIDQKFLDSLILSAYNLSA
jgi:hypothetical protein